MNKKNKILLFGLIGIVIGSFGVTSCAPDYETKFEEKTLEIANRDLAPIAFQIDGGKKDIRVETNVPVENWTVTSNADWCKIEKSTDKIVVSANKNDKHVTRVARITIAYGHQSYNIDVTQVGIESILLVDGKRKGIIKEIAAGGGELLVTVTSNLILDYVSIPDTAAWVELVSVSDTSDPTEKILKFNVEPSYASTPRYSTLILQSSHNFDYVTTFIIKQEQKEWGEPIPVPLTTGMLSANATQSGDGQGLPGLVDNNKNTFYHTLWSSASPGGKPHYVQINLDEPKRFLKFEYVSRNGGDGGGDVKRAGIWVSNTGTNNEADWEKAATITFNLPTGRGMRTSANETANLNGEYKYIRFIPEARRSADPINSSGTNGWWNMADMYLYSFTD